IFSSGGGLPNLNLTAADYGSANPPPPPPTLYPPAPTGNQTAASVAPPNQTSGLPEFSNQRTRGTNSPTPTPLVSPNIIGNNPNPDMASSPAQELAGIKPATRVPPLPTPQLKPSGVEGGTGTMSNDEYMRRTTTAMLETGASSIKGYPAIAGSRDTACMAKTSCRTLIQAQVNKEGTVDSITKISSSNVPAFDDAAEIAVNGMNFGAKDKPMAYQVPVEFKYDPSVCGNAAAPQSSTSKTPATANTSTPQSSPAPKK
ncbi:MAG: TonB family protein, partial [Coleofasciculaceae cyanobacterium]